MTPDQRSILLSLADPEGAGRMLGRESREAVAAALAEVEQMTEALDESLKLQSHYAELLNQYDGGWRRGFRSGDEWIRRLRECRPGTAAQGPGGAS